MPRATRGGVGGAGKLEGTGPPALVVMGRRRERYKATGEADLWGRAVVDGGWEKRGLRWAWQVESDSGR